MFVSCLLCWHVNSETSQFTWPNGAVDYWDTSPKDRAAKSLVRLATMSLDSERSVARPISTLAFLWSHGRDPTFPKQRYICRHAVAG